MQMGEVMKSKRGFLMLTCAIINLIKASTTIHSDPLLKREHDLTAYHRTKQTELLNQLYEVILLRVNSFSSFDSISFTSENNKLQSLELSTWEVLTEFLSLVDTESSPKEAYIFSIERLCEKLQPITQKPEAIQATDLVSNIIRETVSEVRVESKRIKIFASPILQWSNKSPKKTNKQKKKKTDDSVRIKIGSKIYKEFY